MSELDILKQKYFKNGNCYSLYFTIKEEESFRIFDNLISFERPDILSILDDKIIAIEHFEFDCYANNKKGSAAKREEFRINKELNKKALLHLEQYEDYVENEKYHNKSGSLNNYHDNFLKILNSHIDNLDEYTENIKYHFGSEKKIEYWFFAEDTTLLGCYYYKNNKRDLEGMLPISEKLISVLKLNKNICGIIFGIYDHDKYKAYVLKNDKESLDRIIQEDYITVMKKDFIYFTPNFSDIGIMIKKTNK